MAGKKDNKQGKPDEQKPPPPPQLANHTFKSGENWKGNRTGRIKGSLNVKTQLKRFLSAETLAVNPTIVGPDGKQLLDDHGKPIPVLTTLLDQVVLALIGKARKGDVYAINTLFDRLEGKPRQKVEVMGEDGGPLDISAQPGAIDYSQLSTAALTEIYNAAKAAETQSKQRK